MFNPLIFLYKYNFLRRYILKFVENSKSSFYESLTIREIFKKYYKVSIGLYSYGECFIPGAFDPQTTIGRYCSIAAGVRVMNRNHPVTEFTTHPYFFNRKTGFIPKDTIEFLPKKIGNDVWIGYNALILPRVRSIGDGAIIGAGSVVVNDVPDYAIVAGNPARIIKYRFSDDAIAYLKSERWWELEINVLMKKKNDIISKLKYFSERDNI